MFRWIKFFLKIFIIFSLIAGWFLYSAIHRDYTLKEGTLNFKIKPGRSVSDFAQDLEDSGVVKSAFLLKKYIVFKGLDKKVQSGEYEVVAPLTIAKVVEALEKPTVSEIELTILPGWGLQDIAHYLDQEGIVKNENELYEITGAPAVISNNSNVVIEGLSDLPVLADKPKNVSFEGYFRPDTFRFVAGSTAEEVVSKLIRERNKEFTEQMLKDIEASGRTIHEVMVVASLVQKEVRSAEDQAKVADLFWRRYDADWGMQADSTVHYLVGSTGSVFTSQKDRETDSPWNTYKYKGLPPSPISNPSISAIKAAIYPEANDYWYFLTTLDTGEVKYGKTLNEHNVNVQKYLR